MSIRKICLLGDPVINEDGVAAEAISPGHLVKGVTSLLKNTENGVKVALCFALERAELGEDVDDANYAIGDTVAVGVFKAGDRVAAIVPSGTSVSLGAYLAADNAGRLVAASSNTRLARALDAITGITADTRVRVELV